jgi:competence protein ComEC
MNRWLWGLALGLLLLTILPVLPPWPWLLGSGLLVLLLSLRFPRLHLLAAVLLGLCWAVFQARSALDDRIPLAWEEQPVTVKGEISGLPEPSASGGVRFRFQPDCILTVPGQCPLRKGLLWQLNSRSALPLWPGERWQLTVHLRHLHGFASPGAFDTEGWLLEEGISATGSVEGAEPLQAAGWSMDGFRLQVRERFQQLFAGEPEAGVQLALLTGDRSLVPKPLWDVYSRTGISHLMAISGPHITLAAIVLVFFLRRALGRFPRLAQRLPLPTVCLVAGFAVSVAYGFLAGLGIPTERTLLMLAVAVWAGWRQRELPAGAILLRALVLVLLVQPLAVHAAGFWLSFVAVAVLMLLAWSEAGEPLWREFGRTQLIVTLGLLPLTIIIFARVSLVAPLANALAIPLVTFVVVPLGMLALLFDQLWSPAGIACWKLGIWLLHGLDWLMLHMAAWPWAAFSAALPSLAMLSLVLAIACLLLPRGLPGRWLAPFFLLPVFFSRPPLPEGVWRFTLLDVGEGMAAVVQTRNHVLIYNAGPASGPNFDAGSRVVLPYLGWAGIRQVDTLLLSDDSTEHAGGAFALVQGLPVGNVLGSWPPALAALRQPHRPCTTGQHWTWDGVSFSLLAPASEDAKPTCVLRIEGGGHALLLPGWLDHAGEEDLLARPGLTAPLLVLAHEGSSSASGDDFLAAVAPQQALISAGYRNRYHHPSAKVLARLQDQHIPWLSTVDTGTLIYDFHPGQPAVPEPLKWRLAAGHYWLPPQSFPEQSPAKP